MHEDRYNQAEIGVLGLAVMGRNLALNFADHGFKTAIFNRTSSVTEEVMRDYPHQNFVPSYSLEDFKSSLLKPRKILLMIKAGTAVDKVLEQQIPLLQEGDIVIAGGNSYFKDTISRSKLMEENKLNYFGVGISGGEEGARFGPALMPGGQEEAYRKIEKYLNAIAAKSQNDTAGSADSNADGEACCFYTSTDGAGHYVKMIHIGIEYADMQLIAETYKLMKLVLGMNNNEIAEKFSEWNSRELGSYLIEITIDILREKNPYGSGQLLDMILDRANQKGTGKWTNLEAVDLGVDSSVLLAGLNARLNSDLYELRKEAFTKLDGPISIRDPFKDELNGRELFDCTFDANEKDELCKKFESALLLGKIICYAQGFVLLQEAAKTYNWTFNYSDIAKIWRGGCIIRAKLLPSIIAAFEKDNNLSNLLLSELFLPTVKNCQSKLRDVVLLAVEYGIACPAMTAAISYYDSLRSRFSGANLIQAQRDYFGAHTFRLTTDIETPIHHDWTGLEREEKERHKH